MQLSIHVPGFAADPLQGTARATRSCAGPHLSLAASAAARPSWTCAVQSVWQCMATCGSLATCSGVLYNLYSEYTTASAAARP
eukprot:1142057-Pelagomonas_calceolata.AAC.2